MKKLIPALLIALKSICVFAVEHPKAVATMGITSAVTQANAQFSYSYNPADSSWTNVGGWSGYPLHIQKDSTANPDSYYFKHYEKNIQFQKFQSSRNDGDPTSFVWLDGNGYVKKSPKSALTLSVSQISGYVSPYTPSANSATRAINGSTFQVSASYPAWVNYTIRINCVATIGSSASGTVSLQYYNGSSWVDVSQLENSNTVTLAITLNSNTTQTAILSGFIPAGAPVRINSSTSGSATISFVRGQETY